jgi:hypothetical protein
MAIILKNKGFIAKTKKDAEVYHHWKKSDVKGLFDAVCNPGLSRCESELFEKTEHDRLCKVCKIHI